MFGFHVGALYLMLALVGVALVAWTRGQVRSTFARYATVPTSRGLSGADVAAAILRVHDIHDVRIVPTDGPHADHYDPGTRSLWLSRDVYLGRTLAAAGVAAHEVGHALQHARGSFALRLRSAVRPALQVTHVVALPVLLVGLGLTAVHVPFGLPVVWVGLWLLASWVVFQLVTLPVELDASRRAFEGLERGAIVTGSELEGARTVLTAAAVAVGFPGWRR